MNYILNAFFENTNLMVHNSFSNENILFIVEVSMNIKSHIFLSSYLMDLTHSIIHQVIE
jgi:hypothetical protein